MLQVPLSNNPTGAINPVTNTSTMQQFKLPSGVPVNLSRSMISYTMTVAASVGRASWVADDCFQIAQQLSLTTAQGINAADVPFCNRYSKVVDKYFVDRSDFTSRGSVDLQYPSDSLIAANPINTIDSAFMTANTYGLPVAADKDSGFVNYIDPSRSE